MRRVVALALVAVGVLGAVAAGTVGWYRRLTGIANPVSGMSQNGMAYARLGGGPRTLLFIRGGPGNTVTTGWLMLVVSAATLLGPFLASGYTVWIVTRKRDMPRRHSVADMAEDYAGLIADELGGKVDLVIGEGAYGGMIGFWLAARHPERLDRFVAQLAGYQLSEQGRALELDYARLVSEGRMTEATTLAARFLLPGTTTFIARIVGAVQMALFIGRTHPYYASDVLVEAEAVAASDAREVLSDIRVPVLLISCDRDLEFPKEVYEETARLIPDCTLRLYERKTVLQASADRRFPLDVLDFVGAAREPAGRRAGAGVQHIHHEGRIDAPTEHVWAFMCDTSRWHDWDPHSEYADFSGPVDRVGTTLVETSRVMGREIRARHTVVEVEPQRLLHHRSDHGFDVAFRFEPDGSATRMTADVGYELPGHLPGFVKDLLSRPFIERTVGEVVQSIKALAEATAPVMA